MSDGVWVLPSQLIRISGQTNKPSNLVVFMSSASLEILRELPSLSARLRRGQEDRMPGRVQPNAPRVAQPARLFPPADLRPLLPNEEPLAERPAYLGLQDGSSLVVLASVSILTRLLSLPT